MRITTHFLNQAQRGSVPQSMIDVLKETTYPPNSAVVMGKVPTTGATAIAIIRKSHVGDEVYTATCITRYRTWKNPGVLGVDKVFELKR